jgi:hypothetical protein
MKKLFKSMFLLAFIGSSLLVTSCGDDSGKTDDPIVETKIPTLTVNNGAEDAFASLSVDTIELNVLAKADTDVKMKKVTITRAVTGQATKTIFDKTYDEQNVIETIYDEVGGDVILDDGNIITYTVTVTDSKAKTATANYKVTIASMSTSGQTLLGAPGNTANEYRFFGTGDNFRRYRAGTTGVDLAKDNTNKVDFLYFYNSAGAVGNAIYSPDFAFPAGSGWNAEVATWSSKNKTMFKLATDISSSKFDALIGGQFITELNNIDFSVGTLDRIPNLAAESILAYKKADGKRGLIKVVTISLNNSGTFTIVCKAEL